MNESEKKKNVLITGAALSGNLGAVAMVCSIINFLKSQGYEDSQIGISSTRFNFDLEWQKKFAIKLFPHEGVLRKSLLYSFLTKFLGIQKTSKSFEAYLWSDIIIDIHGINFCGKDNLISSSIIPGSIIIIGKILGKKVVKFTQSYGPIDNPITSFFAKLTIPFADLVIAREERSLNYLSNLKIKSHEIPIVDCAFNLPSERFSLATDLLNSSLMKVGICLSDTSREKNDSYKKDTISLIIKLLERNDLHLIIFSHYQAPMSNEEKIALQDSSNDDIGLAKEIFDQIASDRLSIYTDFDSPMEVKGLVSELDLLISSRYHACIAGISQGVPTLPYMSWHHKYEHLIDAAGMPSEFSLSANDSENHYEMILEFMSNIETHKINLKSNLPSMKESSREAYQLLSEYI